MKTPVNITYMGLECTCVGIRMSKWEEYMENATEADAYLIYRALKKHCPEDFERFGFEGIHLKKLGKFNPYKPLKTEKHIIIVHSNMEYFYRYETN